jgi:hypothetical protein
MKRISKFLPMGLVVLAVLCLTVFIYKKTASKPARQPLILTSAVVNQPLPEADLVNISGTRLSDERLRHGKVVLVFTLTTCKPCDQENEFLKTIINIRNDISFSMWFQWGSNRRCSDRRKISIVLRLSLIRAQCWPKSWKFTKFL